MLWKKFEHIAFKHDQQFVQQSTQSCFKIFSYEGSHFAQLKEIFQE